MRYKGNGEEGGMSDHNIQELQQLSLIKEDRKLIKNEYPILENFLPWYARNFKAAHGKV